MKFHFLEKGEILNSIGIYGPNGSGKTAFVESINILKSLMIDIPFPNDLYFFINVLKKDLVLAYRFKLQREKENYIVKYSVKFERDSRFNTE